MGCEHSPWGGFGGSSGSLVALCQRQISFRILCFPRTPLPPGEFCSQVPDSLLRAFLLPNSMALSVSWVAPSWLQRSRAAWGWVSGPEQSSPQAGTLSSKIKHLPAPPRRLLAFRPHALIQQGRRTVLHFLFFLPWSPHRKTSQGDRYAGAAGWMQSFLCLCLLYLPGKACSAMGK